MKTRKSIDGKSVKQTLKKFHPGIMKVVFHLKQVKEQ